MHSIIGEKHLGIITCLCTALGKVLKFQIVCSLAERLRESVQQKLPDHFKVNWVLSLLCLVTNKLDIFVSI